MSEIRTEMILPKSMYDNTIYRNTTTINIEASGADYSILNKDEAIITRSSSGIVQIARNHFNLGITKSIEFRKQQLNNMLRMFDENALVFENALAKDLHRPRLEASAYDVEFSRNHVKTMLRHLGEWSKPEYPTKPLLNIIDGVTIVKEPYGVVLIMAPWNFPINLLFVPASGAIAAGNCVIFKPSEISAECSKIIADLIPKYLDNRCYHVCEGGITETTDLLQQRFDYIFFTGSTTIGKVVHAAANKYLTPVALELGGKSPIYIDETVDIKIATRRILWGKWINAGQICIAPDYLLCTKDMQEKFISTAKEQLKLWCEHDLRNSPDYSRIVNEQHFERLANFLSNNANIVVGGKIDRSQLFIEPTILTNVNPNDPVMQEEIFGPILPVVVIEDVLEAIDFINSREKPLAIYIFTNNKKSKDLIIDRTSCGGITVNDTMMHFTVDSLPFGGVGFSGMGACHGKTSFNTFVHRKGILETNSLKAYEKLMHVRYPPYSDRKIEILNSALHCRTPLTIGSLKYIGALLLGAAIVAIYFKLNSLK